ncbi:SLC29A1_2_3 [Lepeophtheirus salmonis]|uniref:SLC29A1_2_3 n=1 Tax=Lepeophtheirus salmonis TaxID=72036 RepID=A0A7R8D300_LEPSM|nr:SLC29A1_2_3 [Lepeophtheirus salmonis]CAF3010101.1 SLC29A1_2_3 [Lepeophtheirus salmonis]
MVRTKPLHPKDSYRFIFIVMIWIGITTLLPWNMMVAVHEYWMYKFRDIPEQQHLYTSPQNDSNHLKKGELNDTQVHWGSYLSISSMVPYIIGLLFTIICGLIFAKVNTDSLQGLVAQVGVAAAFPSNYMNALTQGQAIGGIISCSVNIGILAAGADHNTAAFMCFVLATLFTFICGVLIILMTKTDFYKYFHPEEKSVFPALTSLISSTVDPHHATEWHTKYFIPIGSFLMYNIGDYFGRFLAGWIQWPKPSSMGSYILLFSSISRIIFIPLFLCCNIQPDNRYYTDVYIESDAAFIILIIIFSITNGYIGNICLMFGPKTLAVQREQMKGGEILIAAMIIGLNRWSRTL